MSIAVRRAVLPLLVLPAVAQAAPKVGTVTSSQNAIVAREGKVVPASDNMPLFLGDRVMTRANGSVSWDEATGVVRTRNIRTILY